MNINHRLTLILAATALIAGCGKDSTLSENSDKVIKYKVSFASIDTKSSETAINGSEFLLSNATGTAAIPVTGVVSGWFSDGRGVATKGQLVNATGSDDTPQNYGITSFVASAFDEATPIYTEEDVTYSSSTSKWSTADTYYWPNETSLDFYAYANLPGESAYTSVAIAETGVILSGYNIPEDASDQNDVLFGSYHGYGFGSGTAEIRFEHPLTAVRFLYGEIEGNPLIKSISLEGVAASGTVAMDEDGRIEWSGVSDYTHSVSQTNVSGLTLSTLSGYTAELIGEPFIIIPQDLEENNVTVTVTLDDDTVFEAMLSAGTWQAGKTNTYTLGLAEDYLLPGLFNVGDDSDPQYVRFTKGNLQANYNDGDPKWRFAENQYDIIGEQDISEYQNNSWYDLFGWGATGKAAREVDAVPFWENGGPSASGGGATSQAKFRKDLNTNGAVLSPDDDWGANIVGNAPANTFQTLTNTQWINLLTRYNPMPSSITIDGSTHYGMVIQPSGTPKALYTLFEWKIAEKNGAVFFPSAGHRNGNTSADYNSRVDDLGFFYWSRTLSNESGIEQTTYKLPYGFGVYGSGTSYTMINWRSTGRAVRLVALQNN